MKTDTTAAEAAKGALFLGDMHSFISGAGVIQAAWDVPAEAMYFRAPTCARRSPARAAVRAARRQGGNNELFQRIPRLTHSGANFQDHDTRHSVRYSSLLHYARAGSN